MWTVTEHEAAVMYAMASLKWYGAARAKSVARSMVWKLGQKGDLKGARTWRLVAEELAHIEKQLTPLGRNNPQRAQA
jgi:hypothetical protein